MAGLVIHAPHAFVQPRFGDGSGGGIIRSPASLQGKERSHALLHYVAPVMRWIYGVVSFDTDMMREIEN
jgi:hypothetical protein